MDALFLIWSVLLVATFTPLLSGGQVVDVRLVNGPSSYEGTVEYTTDNVTWQTTCGANFGFEEAKLVCEHIGANGTNRAIADSPFGSNLTQPTEGDTAISECPLFYSCSTTFIGAVICYDETYLGCYKDDPNDHVLPGDPLIEDSTMTIDKCISHCRESTMADYVYAGVEFGKECYCGVSGADYSQLGAAENGDDDCQSQCGGDSHSSCGGIGHIAVFQIPESSQPVTSPKTVIVTTEDADTSSVPESSQPVTTQLASSKMIDTSPAIQQPITTGHTAVSSTYGEDGTRPDTTTSFCPTQPTHQCASSCNGPIIGLGVVVLLFAIYSVTLTVLYLRIRQSPREKQPLEGVKPEGDTYTDLDIQLHSATPETRASLYQDLLPNGGATGPPNQSPVDRTDMDNACYVNQQMANQQKAMRQRAEPEGDLQDYENFV